MEVWFENPSDLKESHPVQTTKLPVAHEINQETAFNWWVNHVLKKQDKTVVSKGRGEPNI